MSASDDLKKLSDRANTAEDHARQPRTRLERISSGA